MTARRPRSLQWRLISRLTLSQGLVLALLIGINSFVVSALWVGGALGPGYNRRTVEAVAGAVTRDETGRLALEKTEELSRLRAQIDGLWFVVRDEAGQELAEGAVPAALAPLLPHLDTIAAAQFGLGSNGSADTIGIAEWTDTRAGSVHILADTRGPVSLSTVLAVMGSTYGVGAVLIVLMALSTLAATPFVVRRALAGLGRAAEQAARIDIRRSGVRLTTDDVPREILPLVTAVNGALERLDSGYEQHKRFLADAAHELRTPIAILSTRIAALPAGAERTRLMEDTARLSVLTGQLLDLQRIDQQQPTFHSVDIVALARRVIADMAPLAFAAGYAVEFEPDGDSISVRGDDGAIERAVSNLVQNAIDYGGHRGTIRLTVIRPATIEVSDEGEGIPASERDAVFEPFHRLHRTGKGTGLGLDLVRRIMRLHGGDVEVVPTDGRGAKLALVFPAPTTDT